MPEPKPIEFIPKWLRDPSFDEVDEIPVAFGSIPDAEPRIHTRLIPRDHGSDLTARTLGQVLEYKQKLILYAARDVVVGRSANFADLRSLKEPLVKFATLSIEPFEPGSFVIPARLDASPYVGEEVVEPVATDRVIDRFNQLLAAIDQPDEAASMSLGALLTWKELGKLLNKEVESIEWITIDREHNRKQPVVFTPEKVARVEQLLERRDTTTEGMERRKGRLTAFDMLTNAFQLTVRGQKQRVQGTVMAFHAPWMCEHLGQEIELEGLIVRRGRRPEHLTVHRIVESDDE
jgi:hypothetical protein